MIGQYTQEKLTGNASAEVAALEKQLELAHKANEHEQKRVDDLMRERDILTKLKTQAENSSGRQLDLIKINEGTKRNLEQEIRGFRTEAQKQQRLLFQLDKEREKYGQEASESTSKHLQVCTKDPQHLLGTFFAVMRSSELPSTIRTS